MTSFKKNTHRFIKIITKLCNHQICSKCVAECVLTPISHAEACLTLPSLSAGLHSLCSRLRETQACVCAFVTVPDLTWLIKLDWAQMCYGTPFQC